MDECGALDGSVENEAEDAVAACASQGVIGV